MDTNKSRKIDDAELAKIAGAGPAPSDGEKAAIEAAQPDHPGDTNLELKGK